MSGEISARRVKMNLDRIGQGIKERLGILSHWTKEEKHNVDFSDMLKHVFSPTCQILGKRISKDLITIEEDENYRIVYFKGIRLPLYFPKELPDKQLWHVVVEQYWPFSWHLYQIDALPNLHIRKEDIVVDCGAAEGLFTLMNYERCEKIYTLEPLPLFVTSLRKTFEHVNNVQIIEVALSDKQGDAFIQSDGIYSEITSTGGDQRITLETLDSLFYDKQIKIDFVKADIEGFEIEMLQGAKKCIREFAPRFALTAYIDLAT